MAIVMDREGPRGCCKKEGVTQSVISSFYRENTGPQCWLCSTGYGASAVVGELSMSGIATELNNGSVQPSGS